MDIKNITLTFEDKFSFAKTVVHKTVSAPTLEKMKTSIGHVVIDRFNEKTQIHETLKLISIEPYNGPDPMEDPKVY